MKRIKGPIPVGATYKVLSLNADRKLVEVEIGVAYLNGLPTLNVVEGDAEVNLKDILPRGELLEIMGAPVAKKAPAASNAE